MMDVILSYGAYTYYIQDVFAIMKGSTCAP